LIEKPFAKLTEDYNKCEQTKSSVFLNQIGAAFGSLNILVPFSILLLTVITYFYQTYYLHDEIAPETYSEEEKTSALNALAISLLLTRDHLRFRHRQHSEQPNDELIVASPSNKHAFEGFIRNIGSTSSSFMRNARSPSSVHDLENQMSTKDSFLANSRKDNRDFFENLRHDGGLTSVKLHDHGTQGKDHELYNKIIYPLLKVLSNDSVYHSDPHKLKEVILALQSDLPEDNKQPFQLPALQFFFQSVHEKDEDDEKDNNSDDGEDDDKKKKKTTTKKFFKSARPTSARVPEAVDSSIRKTRILGSFPERRKRKVKPFEGKIKEKPNNSIK
jgi:hypothetical protein